MYRPSITCGPSIIYSKPFDIVVDVLLAMGMNRIEHALKNQAAYVRILVAIHADTTANCVQMPAVSHSNVDLTGG